MRSGRHIFALFIIGYLSVQAQGQVFKKSGKDIGISVGYVHQYDNFLNLGLIVGKNIGNVHVPGWAYGLASEIDLENSSVFGIKAFYEVNAVLFGARLNSISYFKKSQVDLRITPEAGLVFGSLCNIYYGYNLPVGESELNEISRSRINVTINLFRNLKVNGG